MIGNILTTRSQPNTAIPCSWAALPGALHPRRPEEWSDWRWQLAKAVSAPRLIVDLLSLPPAEAAALDAVVHRYPALATPYFLALARSWSADDPILRQVLPAAAELVDGGLAEDGLGETACSPLPGLLHRYPDRVLLLVTNHCASLCRHCFRKRLWRGEDAAVPHREDVLRYISNHPEIREVILSGGDALMVESERLISLVAALAALKHVAAIRVASRVPAVLPQRVTGKLARDLAAAGPVWFMTQFNHPWELAPEARAACRHLVSSGIPVLNQTVLLRGVNDCSAILAELFEGLVAMRVKPYYLLHGDPVAGTAHFRTGILSGLDIMAELREKISGLALPKFVVDVPGGGKIALEPDTVTGTAPDGRVVIRSRDGSLHEYC